MNSRRYLLMLAAALLLTPGASAQSSINPTDKFAYGANTGWINLRPSAPEGVVVTETFLSGYAYAANFGWIHLGNGAPANRHTYANNSSTSYGVNHDGAGNLSGLAYGANIGWINFGWATATDPNRPRLDLLTGAFSGFAWSANTGWINLGSGSLKADTLVCIDSDGDGMADSWELQNFGNLTAADGNTDFDGDGASDHDEYLDATDPRDFASLFKLIDVDTNTELTSSDIVFTSNPRRLYRLETSTNLATWNDSGLGVFRADGLTTTRPFTHPASPKRFFRAAAIKPLQP